MENGKTRSSNRWLVVLICVLVVVIVGLGVGVVITIVDRPQYVYDGPVDEEGIIDLTRIAVDLGSVEAGADLYESVINANKDNVNNLLGLRIAYSVFLTYNDLNIDGLKQLDSIDRNELNSAQENRLYTAYRNYYVYMGDEEKVMEYEKKILELVANNNVEQEGVSNEEDY